MSPATTTTITGNLTRDPEIRYTREGQATTSLGVAVNRRWQNRETNEWEESTSFFDVVAWRDLAENVALSLTKGMRVVVTGRLEQRSWETDDGDAASRSRSWPTRSARASASPPSTCTGSSATGDRCRRRAADGGRTPATTRRSRSTPIRFGRRAT